MINAIFSSLSNAKIGEIEKSGDMDPPCLTPPFKETGFRVGIPKSTTSSGDKNILRI